MMVECGECGKEISHSSNKCIHCGVNRFTGNDLVKVVVLVIAALFVLASLGLL